ncbi:MAG: hypothetical protein WA476_15825 [Acidobacteriaceae bacterium]
MRKDYRFIDGLRKFAKAKIEPENAIGPARTYQLGYSKAREATREVALDIEEGVDIVMVKPALFNLDIVARTMKQFHVPLAVYSASGENAIIDAAARMGRLNRDAIMLEALAALR